MKLLTSGTSEFLDATFRVMPISDRQFRMNSKPPSPNILRIRKPFAWYILAICCIYVMSVQFVLLHMILAVPNVCFVMC